MPKQYLFLLVILGLIIITRLYQQDMLFDHPQFLHTKEIDLLQREISPLRQFLVNQIKLLLPADQAGLLGGILIGEKSGISKQFKDSLSNTSTIHIAVVSGQNLSLLSGMLLFMAPLLGRRKTILISLGVCLGYCFFTGLQIPVLRAMVMVTLVSLAQLSGREGNGFWILMLSGLVMLVYEPTWIYSISFQLSFLATLAVVSIAPVFEEPLKWLPDLVKGDFAVSLAAQLVTLPVIAASFGQVSILGIIVNLLVLWTVSFIMISGAVALLLSFVWIGLGHVLILVPGVLLTYFVYIVRFFDQLPFASIKIAQVSGLVWVGYYILLFGVFLMLKKKKARAASSESHQVTSA